MQPKNLATSILFILGLFFLANSKANITGAVIGVPISQTISSFLGIILIVVAIIFLTGKYEKKLDFYILGKNRVAIRGLEDVSRQEIQVNTKPPINSNYLNLNELKELLSDKVISKEDRENIAEKYKPDFEKAIFEGYKRFFSYKNKQKPDLKEKEKEELKKIADKLRISRAAEKVFDMLKPSYDTRRELLSKLKHEEPYILKPIEGGKAAYVHFTSAEAANNIKNEGLFKGEQQALYFDSLEKAKEFVNESNRVDIKKLTGIKNAAKAIIFQTIYPPKKVNKLSGEKTKSMSKAFFENLETDSCYTFETKGISR